VAIVLLLAAGACTSAEGPEVLPPLTASVPATSTAGVDDGAGDPNVGNSADPAPAASDLSALSEAINERLVIGGGCDAPDPARESVIRSASAGLASTEQLGVALADLDSVRSTCDDPERWRSAFATALDSMSAFEMALADELGPFDGRDRPIQTDISLPDGTEDDIVLTVTAGIISDRMHRFLSGSSAVANTHLWFSPIAWGHLKALRDGAATSGPDAIVVGSSMARQGVDTGLLSTETGLDVRTIATGRTGPAEAVTELLPLALDAGGGVEEVILAMSPFEFMGCSGSLDEWRQTNATRVAAFSAVPHLAEEDPFELLMGPPSTDHRVGGPMAVGNARATLVVGLDGRGAPTRQEQVARSLDRNYSDPTTCPEKLDAVRTLAAESGETGRALTLLLLPIESDAVSAHPDGAEGHEAVAAQLTDLVGSDAVIDLTGTLGDDKFHDPVHVNTEGRAELTSLLAEVLVARG